MVSIDRGLSLRFSVLCMDDRFSLVSADRAGRASDAMDTVSRRLFEASMGEALGGRLTTTSFFKKGIAGVSVRGDTEAFGGDPTWACLGAGTGE